MGSDCQKTQNKFTEFDKSNIFSFDKNSSSQDRILEELGGATSHLASGDPLRNIFALVQ